MSTRTKEEQHQYYLDNKEWIDARQRNYYQSHKKEVAAYQKKYWKINVAKKRTESARYRREHPDRVLATRIKHMKTRTGEQLNKQKIKRKWERMKKEYGISMVEYESMLRGQDNRCAICGTDRFNSRGPCVDHDHLTNRIRGILCHNCNATLGLIKDNPLIAERIIIYLSRGGGVSWDK